MNPNDSFNSGVTNATPGTHDGGAGTHGFEDGAAGAIPGASGFNVTSASDDGASPAVCESCGQPLRGGNRGLEQLLGRLGISEEMIDNLRNQFQNVDIDEYLDTARTYLKDGSTRASSYAKENPGKVAAGVAALALGAGLIFAAVNRDRA
ncbi:MAG TPA: hypothetical protein VFO89_11005 [Thermoanaerobaculia bacterium]|nr:hypothetical protein [Thermoanaerobaculia bacterium]